MLGTPDIRIAPDGPEWAHAAASLVHAVSEEAIQSHGRFLLALSGGSTPRTLYQTMVSPEWRARFSWPHIFFLFGDERCVPPEHSDSNFHLAQAALFQPLGIAPDHIYRIQGELPDPEHAAQQYEEALRRLTNTAVPEPPRIDLILLGLGEDGHTASLFPGTTALQEQRRAVTVGHAPTGIGSRLTMTLGVLNRATVVLFLVAGPSKAGIVRAILEPDCAADRAFPAALVAPQSGRLIWMVDRSAAARLTILHHEIRGNSQT
ncbi:MAG: 6-phosphogluconolactonase [Nitrospira sp.]|nr:6-phosphogluconolactonase [Nitrospira sp.]MBH0180115.1 6-phosphogluconolactonase [Nitrospira sp.]